MAQPNDSSLIISTLPWQEVSKLINLKEFKEKFTSIPIETLEFAVNEDNYQILVETALKSLNVSDPEKANIELAAQLADKMKDFATQVLLERKSN